MQLRSLLIRCALAAIAICLWLTASPVVGQLPPASPTPTPAPTEAKPTTSGNPAEPADADPEEADIPLFAPHNKAWLSARIAQLDSMGLDAAEKKAALDSYQEALKSRATSWRMKDEVKLWKKELAERDALIADRKARFAAPLPPSPPLPTKLSELDARVIELEQQVQQLTTQVTDAAAKIKSRGASLAEIPKRLTDAEANLRKVEAQLEAAAATPPSTEATTAAVVALANRKELLQQEIATLPQQQAYIADSELLQLESDLAARELAAKEKLLAQARTKKNRLQQAEADRQAQEAARAAAIERPERIAKLASRNAELAESGKQLQAALAKLTAEKEKRQAERTSLQSEFDDTRTRVEKSGLGVSAGRLLLQQQKNLPHVRDLRRQSADQLTEDADLQFTLYELRDERAALADLDARVDEILDAAGGEKLDESEVRSLLDDQRKYLNDLIDKYQSYTFNLNTLAAEEDALANLADAYGEYIAERVLWVRNANVLSRKDAPLAIDAANWSLDPRRWKRAGEMIVASFERRPASSSLAVLGIAALMFVQRQARRGLREEGAAASKRTCAEFRPTLRAMVHTVVIALPWPAFLWFVSWMMDDSPAPSDFVRSLSGAIKAIAACLLLLETLRALCRAKGLADAHFDWPEACLVQIRRHVRWMTALGLPLLLWTTGLELQETEPFYGTTLGRACFIALMLLLAYLLERMLLGRRSPFRQLLHSDHGGLLRPIEHVWRPATVLLPLALAVLAATGYYFSAQQAAIRLVQSVVLMMGIMVAGGLTRRLILTNRRSLAREQARQRRAQLATSTAASTNEGESSSPTIAPELPTADLVEETVDLAALSEQTQKLVRTCLTLATAAGLVVIWRELLPAVVYKFEQPLLPGFELTWAEALKCCAVLAVTYIAVRDIPALLELALLQRLPLDSGSRYAVSTLSRYVLAAIGIAMAYKALGFTGENIQWLVAAMGVGLGFGLQEIFANFVSGIILLFERPIRVGDVVTLGDKTGAVSRIRMRATTIVDWDRKEYIVPNKDLVTERLLNWTLTDQTNRVVVNVGIAYGSDTEQACRLLIEAAREQPAVLADPAPVATFEGFGESSLNLSLRAYLPSLENRAATIHALHTTIDKKFRGAGLEIPYPQRDLNLRNLPDWWLEAAQREAGRTDGRHNGELSAAIANGAAKKADENGSPSS